MRTVNYMSKPARLGRIEEPEPMVLFLHPAAIIIAGLIVLLIISALLFAAGHIPGTMAMTTLTPLLLFRCFLLNGGFSLCFGYLYRKHGIGYAMIAHGLAHLISDMMMVMIL